MPAPLSGAAAARHMLDSAGLQNVAIEQSAFSANLALGATGSAGALPPPRALAEPVAPGASVLSRNKAFRHNWLRGKTLGLFFRGHGGRRVAQQRSLFPHGGSLCRPFPSLRPAAVRISAGNCLSKVFLVNYQGTSDRPTSPPLSSRGSRDWERAWPRIEATATNILPRRPDAGQAQEVSHPLGHP